MSLSSRFDKLPDPLTPGQREAVTRAYFAGVSDPYGDGDQSRIPDPNDPELLALKARNPMMSARARMEATVPLRSARLCGLDLAMVFLDPPDNCALHYACLTGNAAEARRCIDGARLEVEAGDDQAMTHLLERRISLLRLAPLHYACVGSLMIDPSIAPGELGSIEQFEEIVKELCRAGARLDARDLCGYPPLGHAACMGATRNSVKLIPLLVSFGANPNARSRFGEVLITDSVLGENALAFQAMLDAGADLDAKDDNGISVIIKATTSPKLGKTWVEQRRAKALSEESCDACGKKGVSKFCSKCHKVYYCSRECQVKGWKAGHKEKCGKDSANEFLDIVVGTMTLPSLNPTTGLPVTMCSVTGSSTTKQMKPKEFGSPFSVGVFLMTDQQGKDPQIAIVDKSGGFLMLKDCGSGREVHTKLEKVVIEKGEKTRNVYVLAKWLEPSEASGSGRSRKNVLRLDLSKFLPPPKALW